jgi:uncharacterized membrane protein YhfC
MTVLATLTRFLNGMLMILMPLLAGFFLVRRYRAPWRIWWIGAVTFVLSQVVHIPLNALLHSVFGFQLPPAQAGLAPLLLNAFIFSLSAGLCEETFRYGAYRWWAKDARTWSKGLMLGAGHGGIEAIILGGYVMWVFIQVVALTGADASMLPANVPAQLELYWQTPLFLTLMGAVERLFAIIFHLAAAVVVLQVFLRRQIRWLWLAICLHTLLNFTTITVSMLTAQKYGSATATFLTEGSLFVLSLLNLWIIRSLRRPDLEPQEILPAAPPLPLAPPTMAEIPLTPEKLDQTRYGPEP